MVCPFLCPVCLDAKLEQHYLDWDGWCYNCKNITGDKWSIQNGHWKVKEHSSKMCTPEENMKYIRELQSILDKIGN